MSVTHRRVTQPPYLRRKPPHIAGQLLQLVHGNNHSFEGPLHTASKRGGGSRYSTNGIKYRGFPRVRRSDLPTANATRQGSRTGKHVGVVMGMASPRNFRVSFACPVPSFDQDVLWRAGWV